MTRFISDLIKTTPQIKRLQLCECGIGDEALEILAEGIAQCPTLESIDLRHNLFDDDGFDSLLHAFQHTPNIRTFWIAGLHITAKSARIFIDCIRNHVKELRDVTLDSIDIEEHDHDYFLNVANSLVHVENLDRISFCKTRMSSFKFPNFEVPKIIVNLVNYKQNLNSICLSHCGLSTDEIKVLCDGFGVEHNLNLMHIQEQEEEMRNAAL